MILLKLVASWLFVFANCAMLVILIRFIYWLRDSLAVRFTKKTTKITRKQVKRDQPIVSAFTFRMWFNDEGREWKWDPVEGEDRSEDDIDRIRSIFEVIDENEGALLKALEKARLVPELGPQGFGYRVRERTDPASGKIMRELRIEIERPLPPPVVKERR